MSREAQDSAAGITVRPSRGSRTRTVWDVAAIVDVLRRHADPYELEPFERRRVELGYGSPESTPPYRQTPTVHRPGVFRP